MKGGEGGEGGGRGYSSGKSREGGVGCAPPTPAVGALPRPPRLPPLPALPPPPPPRLLCWEPSTGGSGECRAPSVAGCLSLPPRPRPRRRPLLLPRLRPAPEPAPAPSGLSPAMRWLFRGGGDAILSSGVYGVEPGRAARSGARAERGRQGKTPGHEFLSLHHEASGSMILKVPSASTHALKPSLIYSSFKVSVAELLAPGHKTGGNPHQTRLSEATYSART